jgi:hypothetical protein
MKHLLLLLVLAGSAGAQQITVGTAAPAVGACIDIVQVGSLYVRSQDPANGPEGVFRCIQTGPTRLGAAAYGWQPIGHFVGASLPARCAAGDIAVRTGVPAGQNIYACTATDTWNLQAGGGGGDSTPGGTDGQIQINNAGALAGAPIANCVAAGGVLRYNSSSRAFSCHTLAVADVPAHASTHAALGSDPVTLGISQISSLTAELAAKEPGLGTPSVSGYVLSSTTGGVRSWVAATGTISTVFGRTGAISAATGDYTVGQITGAAGLASPAFTGNPTAPTQPADNNSTRLATTAYVDTGLATRAATGASTAVNGQTCALGSSCTVTDSTKVPTSRTVNGYALTSNISLAKGDVGLSQVDNTTDLNKPISTATQSALDALEVLTLRGKGTYVAMSGTSATANDIWLLTDACTSGVCTQGGCTGGFAFCVWNGATWGQVIPGGGAAPPPVGSDTTVYGGFTGGGTTITVSSCTGTDDTATLQAALNSLSNNGTLDITASTACAINTAGLTRSGLTNARITSSNGLGVFKEVATGTYTPAYSSAILITSCTNCLFDKFKVDGNDKKGQALFCHFCTNSSAQNIEAYDIAYDAGGSGPYAAVKFDGGSGNFIVNNNLHDFTGVDGGEGVRCIWAGVGGEYETNITIKNNTCASPGHTGIVTEGSGPIGTGNIVINAITQGTGMKFIPSGPVADAVFENNTIDGTKDGGFQIDGSSVHPSRIDVRNNVFKNIGSIGSSFGALYLSGSGTLPSAGVQNVRFTGNQITNAKRLGNVNYGYDLLYQNNTVVSGSAVLELEDNASRVTVLNSGSVNIGTNISTVTVDGVIVVP